MDRVFGNPDTTELPFLAARSQSKDAPEYVLGVHAGSVAAMADGYARATHRPAFVSRCSPATSSAWQPRP
ncbi:thiamine pyrophosphate-binding protein [Streptomyces sp. NPDC019531]|uniref:thiamine pyrophosphate-binding protein n=1 Tax=Streptomyces sp. NPDC019531 TaxID=3365062 RepID=UPI00384FE894